MGGTELASVTVDTAPGVEVDVAVVLLAVIATTVLAAQVQVLLAGLLGDRLAAEVGTRWDLRARIDRTGTLIVPALLALAAGAAVAWPARPPVRRDQLAPPRRVLLALAAPTTALVVAWTALAAAGAATEGGALDADGLGTVATNALLLAGFWALPAPPLPGGTVVGELLRGETAVRWARWARRPVAPWGYAVGAVLVLTDLAGTLQRTLAG